MIDLRSPRAFGFEFPEKFETLAVPVDNGIRLDKDESLAPRSPNSGNQNPEEPIHHSNLRPLVRPFHNDQLLVKRKVFGSEIRSDFELRPYEQNKISKRFHHHYSLAGTQKYVNNYMKYELLRRTTMKVQPIHKLKDIRAIKKLISGSPRDSAIFAIGINTNLRASDILRLIIGQVKGVKPGLFSCC